MNEQALLGNRAGIKSRPIEVLVLSPDLLRCDLLTAGIRKSDHLECIGTADWSDFASNLQEQSQSAQVVIIDLDRHDEIELGLELGQLISRQDSSPAVIILAGSHSILSKIREHISVVSPKWSFLTTNLIKGLDDLLRVIDSAVSGMTIVDPGFFPRSDQGEQGEMSLNRPLTARQLEVLELVSHGYNNEGIAVRLNITPRTVEYHLNEAYTAIKYCHSEDHNPRVFAAKMYKEHFGLSRIANPMSTVA